MRNLKRALSLLLSSTMVLGMVVMGGSAAGYQDVDTSYNQEAIEVLQAVGIMTGDENGNFNPDATVTRNEMAVIMSNLMAYNVATYSGTSPFTDVPSWAEPYVAACWTNGITAGTSETTYGGDQTVTTAQAALMIMKALGYFQYQSDFGSDWQLATVSQGNKIDLFNDVNSGVKEAMTRNDVAQLVLNGLESGTVQAETSGTITVGDITIVNDVKYNYITSGRDYAAAIDNLTTYTSSGSTGGSEGYIVELGEKLYQGDLKKATASDDFGRPANIWTYKSDEVGKYADSAVSTWTGTVSEKDLYTAAGSAAYDNYKWTIFQNGYERYTDGDNHAARDAAIAHSKTSGEGVLVSGNGVLTQLFVDDSKKTVVLTMVETALGEVTRVTENGDQYDVTISQKTKVNNGQGGAYTPDSTFTTDQKFSRGDVVVYTASVSSGEIESMSVAKTVSGKVTAVKNAGYVSLDGTQYSYNSSYTKSNGASDYAIASGLYNLDDGTAGQNPSIDKDATLYLDAYGYVVAFKGATNTPEDYLYVTELGDVFKSEPSAKVVFYDGTKATIDIDKVVVGNNTYDATSATGKDGTDGTYTIKEGNVYKFTKGSSTYDLEVVNAVNGTDATIKKDNPTITATGAANAAKTDNDTVFVDVVNNKSWTGYSNVSSKAGATVDVVKDSDGVALIVFISGNFTTTPDDNDYIILTGTGMEAVKDSNNKTVYRLISAYDINGNKLDNVYQNSSTAPSEKGLYLITNRDGDDYIQSMTLKTALVNDSSHTVAGSNASLYATSAGAGLLVLNNTVDFGNSNKKSTFAINNDTNYIVVTQTSTGDVDKISVGSLSDIETYESASGADNTEMTGVYVMTVGDATDAAPVAESVLVIVPYTGSTVTPVTPSTKGIDLVFNQSAYAVINDKNYTSDGTVTGLTPNESITIKVTFGSSVAEDMKVVKYNDKVLDSFGDGTYVITVADGAKLEIGLKTANLTLPANVTAKWDADTAEGIKGGTADASKTTAVPVGANVTLTVDSSAKYYVNYGTEYKKADESFSAFKMNDAVSVSADKYYKVTLTTAVGTTSSNLNGNTVTAACEDLADGSAFVKAGTLNITFTATDGSSGNPSDEVQMSFKSATGAASTTYSSATKILDNSSKASEQTITGDTITISDDQASDITIAYDTQNP